MELPKRVESEEELEELLTRPTPQLVRLVASLDGDFEVLGAGGKMGPYMAVMLARAVKEAGAQKRVIAVSRFSDSRVRRYLEENGVEVVSADLLEDGALESLPYVKNVVFAAGYKFGSTGNEPAMWATNTYLPARVALRFKASRIVALSSGNVYPLVPIWSGGSREEDEPGPIGEYAMSRLGGERLLQYFSAKYKIPITIIRLNYAGELRYGVLVDIALAVYNERPIDLRMGYFNTIWLGDANDYILRSFSICSSPPTILNVTGPEIISVRWAAEEFGRIFGKRPIFVNKEEETALLNNASKVFQLFGYPRVPLRLMMEWVAHWIASGKRLYNKPTHYEVRDGRY
jgi:nucleoside-diphosphate-sugar epimerase